MNPFLVLTLAVALSMLVIPVMHRWAPRLGLVDMPDPRKVHSAPIPRVGGWGITLGSLVPLSLALRIDPVLLSFVAGALVLFLFGLWDDAREIGHWPKFLGQLIAAAIVVFYGDLYVTRLPFLDAPLPDTAGRAFTIFALVGMINAINHSDGLDGLAGGESLLSLIAFTVLGYLGGNALITGMALAMIGGILGFLRYNGHPARVFMGDCGSQTLGFALGFLAVHLTQVSNTAVSAALPLLLLGMPIADILVVLYRRMRGGMNWFKATRNHVHHRLLDLGFTHAETVVIIYSIQAALVLAAVLLRYESDLAITLAYLGVIVALFAGLGIAERAGWRRRPGAAPRAVDAASGEAAAGTVLGRWLLGLIVAVTLAVMAAGAAAAGRIPRDIALPALGLALLVAVELLRPRLAGALLSRVATYATAICCVYLLTQPPGGRPVAVAGLVVTAVVVLALAIATYLRVAPDRSFSPTPTDYLIVFGIAALAVYGSIDIRSRAAVELVVYTAVLLYGCEIIITRAGFQRLLRVATFATLLVIAVRGAI